MIKFPSFTLLIPVSSPKAFSPEALDDLIWKVDAPIATLNISKGSDGTKEPFIFSKRGNFLITESLLPMLILPIPFAASSNNFRLV